MRSTELRLSTKTWLQAPPRSFPDRDKVSPGAAQSRSAAKTRVKQRGRTDPPVDRIGHAS